MAPFDITELDGEEFNSNNYNETIKKLYSIFKGELVKPVEYKELSSTIYGGGNRAVTGKDTNVKLTGGTITNIYGGGCY